MDKKDKKDSKHEKTALNEKKVKAPFQLSKPNPFAQFSNKKNSSGGKFSPSFSKLNRRSGK